MLTLPVFEREKLAFLHINTLDMNIILCATKFDKPKKRRQILNDFSFVYLPFWCSQLTLKKDKVEIDKTSDDNVYHRIGGQKFKTLESAFWASLSTTKQRIKSKLKTKQTLKKRRKHNLVIHGHTFLFSVRPEKPAWLVFYQWIWNFV